MKKFITLLAFGHATFASNNKDEQNSISNDYGNDVPDEIILLDESTKVKVDDRLKALSNPNLILSLTPKEALNLACTNKQIYNDINFAFFQPYMKDIQNWESWMANFRLNTGFRAKELVEQLESQQLKSLYFIGARNENFDGASQTMDFTVNGERSGFGYMLDPHRFHGFMTPNIFSLDLNEDGSIELVRQPASCKSDNGYATYGEIKRKFSKEEVETLIVNFGSNVGPFHHQFRDIANQMKEKYGEQWSQSRDDDIWKEYEGLQNEILNEHIQAVDYIPSSNQTFMEHKKTATKTTLKRLLNTNQ